MNMTRRILEILLLLILICGEKQASGQGLSVQISSSGSSPTLGEEYTLNCTVTGFENITNSNIVYLWIKTNDTTEIVLGTSDSNILSLTPFWYQDVGQYTCQVTVEDSNPTVSNNNTYDVRFQIPAPTVIIESNQSNPVLSGSSVTLTCTVGLSPVLQGMSVTVNTQLIHGWSQLNVLNTTTLSMSGSNYTSRATITSFGSSQSGYYRCKTTVSATVANSFITPRVAYSNQRMIAIDFYISHGGVGLDRYRGILIYDIISWNAYYGLWCNRVYPIDCTNDSRLSDSWILPNGQHLQAEYRSYGSGFRVRKLNDISLSLVRIHPYVRGPTGTFCCRRHDESCTLGSTCISVVSRIWVWILSKGTGVVGQDFSLTCTHRGAGSRITTYQWRKNNYILQNETAETLSFSPLKLSDAGQYRCRLSARGLFNHVIRYGTRTITLTVPSPASVTLMSDPVSPIQPMAFGSDATLTCTVLLNNASGIIDIPVFVNTVWTGPAEFIADDSGLVQPVVGSSITYISTATINSFGREKSGNYTCTVSINSLSMLSYLDNSSSIEAASIYIDVLSAPVTSPEGFTEGSVFSSTRIQLVWSPLPFHNSSTIVEAYSLTCISYLARVGSVSMTYTEAGSYTLGGLRPATEYNCSVFAFNSAGNGPMASISVITMDEAMLFQLRLTGISDCSQWVTTDTHQKLEDIVAATIESTQTLCRNCGLIRDRITDEIFRCFPGSPQAVTYRAVIHGTASTNSSQLIYLIEQWTAKGANIIIQRVLLEVDGSCVVAVVSLIDEECQPRNTNMAESSNNIASTSIIGGVIVVVIVLVILTVVMIISISYARKYLIKTNSQSNSPQTNKSAQDPKTVYPIYEVVDPLDGAEYEDMDSPQAYEDVQAQTVTIKKPTSCDYEPVTLSHAYV